MTYRTIDGVPHINGQPATYDADYAASDVGKALADVLSAWRCPECGAQLALSGICLNACHLTPDQQERFRLLMEAVGHGATG